jgi:hypothetical protein
MPGDVNVKPFNYPFILYKYYFSLSHGSGRERSGGSARRGAELLRGADRSLAVMCRLTLRATASARVGHCLPVRCATLGISSTRSI